MKEYNKGYKRRWKDRHNTNLDGYVFVKSNPVPVEKLINEAELEIEDAYCVVWGCGKKLSLQEKLFGVKCIHHSHFVKNLVGVW